ncbi:MAG TPA: hypothetical protein VMA09_09950 [Candidatus Binataceae bacterium]|nr:hypothetical protein [Candidatus Binataceae bacterium]
MKHAKTIALAAISLLALIALAGVGAVWFAAMLYGLIPLGTRLLKAALNLPSNPVRSFATLDMLTLIVMMSPWAAIAARVYWSVEGAWLDLLDPRGRALDAVRTRALKSS